MTALLVYVFDDVFSDILQIHSLFLVLSEVIDCIPLLYHMIQIALSIINFKNIDS